MPLDTDWSSTEVLANKSSSDMKSRTVGRCRINLPEIKISFVQYLEISRQLKQNRLCNSPEEKKMAAVHFTTIPCEPN